MPEHSIDQCITSNSPHIVIMAGGTGGHVFPGLAVAQELKDRGWRIDWFGTADKMEAQTVPKHGFAIHFLDISGLRGKGILRKLVTPFRLIKAVLQARKILKELQPDMVLGMGGYASGPGGIAAYTLGIPLIVHEQNAVFGMTNRYLSKLAKHVLCGFDVTIHPEKSKAPSNTIFVGNPLRRAFLSQQNEKGSAIELEASESENAKSANILITGGSLGAQALNEIVPKALIRLSDKYHFAVMHQAGKTKESPVNKAYIPLIEKGFDVSVRDFIDDVHQAYEWADIVICRAGALTVAEVAISGKTAIFVPLPIAVDDHQTINASNLCAQGAAMIIPQSTLEDELPNALEGLLSDIEARRQMAEKASKLAKADASVLVADYCVSLLQGGAHEFS
ncbi:undecaprenyldiphospho-muramoylpentapeptide beta-N-acetylglucosaminyltransferase [Ningiella sp. W23]|uniref:undecaprenyldiphospho-muramoylpentapeptide beta-N-acetylglucosaminyltransferase n=1 Tax=Ningiella sp. W23 TaxID=3023715 RepID=UPI003757E799